MANGSKNSARHKRARRKELEEGSTLFRLMRRLLFGCTVSRGADYDQNRQRRQRKCAGAGCPVYRWLIDREPDSNRRDVSHPGIKLRETFHLSAQSGCRDSGQDGCMDDCRWLSAGPTGALLVSACRKRCREAKCSRIDSGTMYTGISESGKTLISVLGRSKAATWSGEGEVRKPMVTAM